MMWTWLLSVWISLVSVNGGSCFQFLLASPFPKHHTHTHTHAHSVKRKNINIRFKDKRQLWRVTGRSCFFPPPTPLPITIHRISQSLQRKYPVPLKTDLTLQRESQNFFRSQFYLLLPNIMFSCQPSSEVFPETQVSLQHQSVSEPSRAHIAKPLRPLCTRQQLYIGKRFYHHGFGWKVSVSVMLLTL